MTPGAVGGSGGGSLGVGGGTGVGGADGPRDSGRVTIRKLNRSEYDNTVHDLLGTKLNPGLSFMNDAPEVGFDNNASLLSISPALAGLYQTAAETLAAEAIAPERRASLGGCDFAAGESCLRTIITTFGAKAYRRPVTEEDVANYLALAAQATSAGATAEETVRTVLEAMLLSPHFLYRVELDADPTSLQAHPVGPYEMASRLSYLVYRSMPDQALFDAATAQKLSATPDIQAQLTRMLATEKGEMFARDFSSQWLGIRTLEQSQFDEKLYPSFTPALAASMKLELTSFFADFVRDNRPAQQLLVADFSYLDSNLSTLYQLPPVSGSGLQRTTIASPVRGGLLLMAGTLAVTSYSTRTSLVKRGNWILGQMLCDEPPPPPPNIPQLPEGMLQGTQREILAQHRTDPSCSACHEVMDNIGLALENYDAVGAFRTTDRGGATIDATGVLPNGGPTFVGGRELSNVIAADPRFGKCLAEKMLGYALGRTISTTDEPYIGEIAAPVADGLPGVRDVLARVVASDPFTLRHGEAAQ
jgi:Protein of unknown function (DUF1592)/Protein of unknown function (DUF1588)/Protein of unknown function (DUF1595)/Protein of unknown function (DUF1587)/Protein of unknown function (DUF1585)